MLLSYNFFSVRILLVSIPETPTSENSFDEFILPLYLINISSFFCDNFSPKNEPNELPEK